MSKDQVPTSALDWSTGVWRRAGAGDADAEIVITADWAPIRKFAPLITQDPEGIYGDLLPLLHKADLRITNLECPLTQAETPVWKSGAVLRGAAGHISGLSAVPFDMVTLANNHVFDYGPEAFNETRDLLAVHNITGVGAGLNHTEAFQPLIHTVKGVRLAIVNFSEGEDLTAAGENPGVAGWEVDLVCDLVADLKSRVDLVVVICHCGVEYIPFPPPYVAKAFQRIARRGADLVIGHHPHVPQGIQLLGNVPICYSLGNFVFYQETDLYFRKVGYWVKAGVNRGGLTHIAIVPYEIQAGGLALLKGPALERFMGSLEEISAPLTDNSQIEGAWHGFLCRYGKAGFQREIGMLMDEIRNHPQKGAAMFRNRVATPQHNQHWIDALSRIIDGTIGDAPPWALARLEQWFSRKRSP
jgi:poly-gamma-glutamate synthesis protein (capsule biosynthesis protein)